jgi:hypothetical protein
LWVRLHHYADHQVNGTGRDVVDLARGPCYIMHERKPRGRLRKWFERTHPQIRFVGRDPIQRQIDAGRPMTGCAMSLHQRRADERACIAGSHVTNGRSSPKSQRVNIKVLGRPSLVDDMFTREENYC